MSCGLSHDEHRCSCIVKKHRWNDSYLFERRCNSALSEVAAIIALQATEQIISMHRATIAANIVIADEFFKSRGDRFAWHAPDGGSIAFPRLLTGL